MGFGARSNLLIAVMIAAVVVLPPAAVASHGASLSDERIVLASAFGESINTGCQPSTITPLSTVYELPEASGGDIADGEHTFRVEPSNLLIVMPWFYRQTSSGECEALGNGRAPMGGFGITETGFIPEDAEYIQVVHWAGAGQFSIEIPNPACTGSDGKFC